MALSLTELLAKVDTVAPLDVEKVTGSAHIENNRIVVVSEYDSDLVDAQRQIDGRKWDGRNNSFPLDSADDVAILCRRFEISISDELAELAEKVAEESSLRAVASVELHAASSAQDANIEIDGLGGELLPFQRAGVAYALKTRRTFIADEPGLGKTIQALATIKAADAFPAVVVCPATLKLNWQREANKWLPDKTVEIVGGRTCYEVDADIVIVNYDVLPAWVDCLIGSKALILDEAHYAKSPTAKRTKAATVLAKNVPADGIVLALTGTPVINRPSELVSQLRILGTLKSFGNAQGFHSRYCNFDGYGWTGGKNLEELNVKLRGLCYVRRTKKDVLPELPAKRKAEVFVSLGKAERSVYDKAENDLFEFLGDCAREKAEAIGENGDHADYIARQRAQSAEALVRLNTLRRVSGEGKISLAKEWIANFLADSDEKLVVFAHHKSVVQGLAAEFDAPRIDGSTSQTERQVAVDRFQSDPTSRLIVCSIKAAGLGITLTAASNVLFIESDWTPAGNAQAEDRCHRIGQNDSVTAWYLHAENTVDARIAELLAEKALLIDAATEGGDLESGGSIAGAILADFRARVS